MEIQPVIEEVSLSEFRKLAVSQAVVQARLLPQPGVSIVKILSISADAKIASTEVFTGEARYGGSVDFKVLFLGEDGRNHSLNCVAEFSDKMENPAVNASLSPWVNASVLDTEVVNLKNDEIKLASVVEISLCAVLDKEVKFISNGGEGVYTHIDKVEYAKFITSGKAVISQQNRAENLKFSQILQVDSSVILKEAKAGRDLIEISGEVVSYITGETDDGLIAQTKIETPFIEEIGANEARSGDSVKVSLTVSAQVNEEENEANKNLTLEYALDVKYAVFTETSVTVVTDAFSPTHDLIPTYENATVFRLCSGVGVSERVDGSVTLQNDMPVVDSILATTALKNTVTNAVSGDGEALVEGVVSGNIIYYSAESDSKNSVAVELPYSIKVEVDGLKESDEIFVCGKAQSLNTKIRRGNEIDIKAEIALFVQPYSSQEKRFMTGLEVGEERQLPTCAFSVRIAKANETLWEVAKALGTTPELIMAQNPSLTLPLSGGERVIVYRHLGKD